MTPANNNRARWQGWTPSRRDRFEQDITNRILADPAWTAWCDDYTPDEWNDYIALLLHIQGLGSPTDWSDYRTRWRQAQTKTGEASQKILEQKNESSIIHKQKR